MESIPGIVGECGGNLVCATCHVYVDEQWAAKVGPPGSLELAMLDLVPEPRPCSRLSCQITLTADLDGLILHTPASQR
jgi:2Fe-2S ferredoxin